MALSISLSDLTSLSTMPKYPAEIFDISDSLTLILIQLRIIKVFEWQLVNQAVFLEHVLCFVLLIHIELSPSTSFSFSFEYLILDRNIYIHFCTFEQFIYHRSVYHKQPSNCSIHNSIALQSTSSNRSSLFLFKIPSRMELSISLSDHDVSMTLVFTTIYECNRFKVHLRSMNAHQSLPFCLPTHQSHKACLVYKFSGYH